MRSSPMAPSSIMARAASSPEFKSEVVGAYDMTPGLPFHAKGEANGYLVTLGGMRLIFSGVGECVPEIQALQNIHVAVMPMNLPVDQMRPVPVAECVKTAKPKVVYLNHYVEEVRVPLNPAI